MVNYIVWTVYIKSIEVCHMSATQSNKCLYMFESFISTYVKLVFLMFKNIGWLSFVNVGWLSSLNGPIKG